MCWLWVYHVEFVLVMFSLVCMGDRISGLDRYAAWGMHVWCGTHFGFIPCTARATRLLVILPYWLTSFAPRGQEHFHCSLG